MNTEVLACSHTWNVAVARQRTKEGRARVEWCRKCGLHKQTSRLPNGTIKIYMWEPNSETIYERMLTPVKEIAERVNIIE